MSPAKRIVAAVVLACAATAVALAQQPAAEQPQPTFKGGTRHRVAVRTVADAQKRLVPDLTKEDFEVFDNDKPQPLISFENETQPITVVVMLDTSGSMTGSIELLKQAAEQFLMRLLPEDKGRVGAFNDKIQIQLALHERSRRAGQRRQGSRLRERDEAVGCGGGEPRRAEGDRRTARGARVHRRRRHGEPTCGWARSSIARAPKK